MHEQVVVEILEDGVEVLRLAVAGARQKRHVLRQQAAASSGPMASMPLDRLM